MDDFKLFNHRKAMHKIVSNLNVFDVKNPTVENIDVALAYYGGKCITEILPSKNVVKGKTYIESQVNPSFGKKYVVFLMHRIQGLIYFKNGYPVLGNTYFFGCSFHKVKQATIRVIQRYYQNKREEQF